MPPAPTPTLPERFGILIRCLYLATYTRTHFGLASALIAAITDRLRGINQRFARLASRIHAGQYVPRRRAAPRTVTLRRARTPSKLPRRAGWMLKLVPEAVWARSQLESMFRDPEMVALLEAAPAALRRPLRSLCHMLGATPPPILAQPPKPAPPHPATPDAPQATVPPAPPPWRPPAPKRPARTAPALAPLPSARGPPFPA